jgi:alpha-1,3-rhamnosyl/mannosyltransferase
VRVAFDSRPARDTRGIGRYARCLLDALRDTMPPGSQLTESHHPRGATVYHAPWIDGAKLYSAVPQVVTVHDLVPLKRRDEYLRTGLRFRLHYAAVRRAARIIVPTHAVARDASALLGIDPRRIAVIAEAPAPAMRPRPHSEVAAVRERYGVPADYLLWVGGLVHPDPRKRIAQLAAVKRELPLVLAGPAGEWTSELPNVTLTGLVSDDELAALYTGARALVFPSDDEGFGLPPVEALACGTPVVASDVPAVREVLDGRATLVPAQDLEALIGAAQTVARPAPPPPPWSWREAAASTWRVYEDVAGGTTPNGTRRPRARRDWIARRFARARRASRQASR